MNLNKAQLIGRATANPELRSTPSGQSVATLGIATNRTWTDKAGAKHEETEFTNCVFWGKQAEIVSQFVTKGSTLYVEGRLKTRQWEDKQGGKRSTTEVMVTDMQLGAKPQGAPKAEVKPEKAAPAMPPAREERGSVGGDEEDSGREMKPLFGEDEAKGEINVADIPF
jgi:single-strand DNA-binding protein